MGREPTVQILVKASPELRKRVLIAKAEEDMTYAELLEMFLNQRDKLIASRARLARTNHGRQVHPLHIPDP